MVSSNEKKYKVWHLLEEKFSPKMKNMLNMDQPFQLVHESEEKLHGSFVTAIEYVRLNFEDYHIISGDALGHAVIYHYEFTNGKKISGSLIKSFQANDTKIKVILLFSFMNIPKYICID